MIGFVENKHTIIQLNYNRFGSSFCAIFIIDFAFIPASSRKTVTRMESQCVYTVLYLPITQL